MDYHGVDLQNCSAPFLTSILEKERKDFGCLIEFVVTAGMQPPDIVYVHYTEQPFVRFEVCTENESLERLQWFTAYWLCCWPLFAEVKRRYPRLRGRITFNIDDYAPRAGLAFCGNNPSNVLIPDPPFMVSSGYRWLRGHLNANWVPWHLRDDTLYWRGSSTGARELMRLTSWRELPRLKLCLLAKSLNRPHDFDFGITNIVQMWDAKEIEEVIHSEIVAERVPITDFMRHRFVIDIDGNTNAWEGLFSKFLMGCCVFKIDSVMGFRQWYYDKLIPWKNFVPVSVGMNELPDLLDWARAHPEAVREIADAGRKLARNLTFESEVARAAERIAHCLT